MRELNLKEIEAVSGGGDPIDVELINNPQSDLGHVINDIYEASYNAFTYAYEAIDNMW